MQKVDYNQPITTKPEGYHAEHVRSLVGPRSRHLVVVTKYDNDNQPYQVPAVFDDYGASCSGLVIVNKPTEHVAYIHLTEQGVRNRVFLSEEESAKNIWPNILAVAKVVFDPSSCSIKLDKASGWYHRFGSEAYYNAKTIKERTDETSPPQSPGTPSK